MVTPTIETTVEAPKGCKLWVSFLAPREAPSQYRDINLLTTREAWLVQADGEGKITGWYPDADQIAFKGRVGTFQVDADRKCTGTWQMWQKSGALVGSFVMESHKPLYMRELPVRESQQTIELGGRQYQSKGLVVVLETPPKITPVYDGAGTRGPDVVTEMPDRQLKIGKWQGTCADPPAKPRSGSGLAPGELRAAKFTGFYVLDQVAGEWTYYSADGMVIAETHLLLR